MCEQSESILLGDTFSPASTHAQISDPLPWPASQGILLCPFCAPILFCSVTTNIYLKRGWKEEPTVQFLLPREVPILSPSSQREESAGGLPSPSFRDHQLLRWCLPLRSSLGTF